MQQTEELVGYIGVDAGCCWVGDPCYIMDRDEPRAELGNDWGEFCDLLGDASVKAFGALGICVTSGHGDGQYPVYVTREPNGLVTGLRVAFNE